MDEKQELKAMKLNELAAEPAAESATDLDPNKARKTELLPPELKLQNDQTAVNETETTTTTGHQQLRRLGEETT